MADTKISDLAAVTSLLGTDEFVLARSGATKKITEANLATALGSGGAWSAWTPALTAATTPPTLGSGSSASGRYLQIGSLVIANGDVAFGSSGTNAGSGIYSISVPVNFGASAGAYAQCGFVVGFDSSTGTVLAGIGYRDNLNHQFNILGTGISQTFAHNVPWAWAASDNLQFLIAYEGTV